MKASNEVIALLNESVGGSQTEEQKDKQKNNQKNRRINRRINNGRN